MNVFRGPARLNTETETGTGSPMAEDKTSGPAEAALRERVKELACLYEIAQISSRPEVSLDSVFRDIAAVVRNAWQHPEIAGVRIDVDGQAHTTPGFREGPWRQATDIVASGERRGTIEVVYFRESAVFDEGPFLKEERHLLDAVAGQLGLLLERREAENERFLLLDQLRHADRLAAIGQLAAGVAHELNEPLNVILGFAQLARKNQNLPERTRGDLERIEWATLNARETIRKLLVFARQVPPSRTRLDLNRVIDEAMRFFHARCAKAGVDTLLDLAPEPAEVVGDPAQLNQVLVNLVVNALHAMPDGGRLTVRTRAEGEHVSWIVEDTGTGMTGEVLRQLFTPFFTTKDLNEGTGLGLPVAHGIVASHGGSIQVRSEPGRGARFEIRLPAAGGTTARPQGLTPSRLAADAVAVPPSKHAERHHPAVQPKAAGERSIPLRSEGERILVVDDSEDTLELLRRSLSEQGYRVFTSGSVGQAIRMLQAEPVDLVVTDLKMPKVSGLGLVRYVRENLKDTEVMMITGYPSLDGAVEAVKTGADEYLAKPFTDEELVAAVSRTLDKLRMRRSGRTETDTADVQPCGIVGESAAMREVLRAVGKAATTAATLLITGESGTGKELVARAIHYNGPRASAPFVPVNCGGIPEGLIESELFGHVKGAFSGAAEARAGLFHAADGGTIFFDEISEMSLAMQVKLLRVLQDREVWMVGSNRPRKVDVRILGATNIDLAGLVKGGAFREDLFYRLNVIPISIPPLRERCEDVLPLARHFVSRFARDLGRPEPGFSDAALRALRDHTWPGNVRELENVMQRLVVMAESDLIDVPDLPRAMRFSTPRDAGLDRSLAELEAEHIRGVLANAGGNKTRAAEILGIDRKTLREKLKALEQVPA